MTPELKKQMKDYKRERAIRILKQDTGEFILFAFPFLVFAAIALVTGMTLIASYALDIPASQLWGF